MVRLRELELGSPLHTRHPNDVSYYRRLSNSLGSPLAEQDSMGEQRSHINMYVICQAGIGIFATKREELRGGLFQVARGHPLQEAIQLTWELLMSCRILNLTLREPPTL